MSCYRDMKPMGDLRETLERLCQEAVDEVDELDDLTERERHLRVCVLGIRSFGRALRASMDDNGAVFAGFFESGSTVILHHGDDIWGLVDSLTETMLDCIGDLERLDQVAAENRRRCLPSLEEIETLATMTESDHTAH